MAWKQENKRPKNHSWRIVSAAVPIIAHDGLGHDDGVLTFICFHPFYPRI